MDSGKIKRVTPTRTGDDDLSGMSPFEVREFLGLQDWETPDPDHLVLHCRHPKFEDWAIRAVFEVYSKDVALSRLTIYPASQSAPPGGLTDEVRRSVRLDDLRKMAQRRLRLREVADLVEVDPSTLNTKSQRGRKGRSKLELAKIAEEYVRLLDETDHVAQALASYIGLSEATARSLVWQAREAGLIDPGSRRSGWWSTHGQGQGPSRY